MCRNVIEVVIRLKKMNSYDDDDDDRDDDGVGDSGVVNDVRAAFVNKKARVQLKRRRNMSEIKREKNKKIIS
jgi:hypothetical protein